MINKLVLIIPIVFLLQSCDRDSRGIIQNDSTDTIKIQTIANDVKDIRFNPGNKRFPSQYFAYFKDTGMINPKTNWNEPIFKGEFNLLPKSSFLFGRSMGSFGTPAIWFDTLRIIRRNDTLIYNSKNEIFAAFNKKEDGWFYLIIE